MQQETIQGFRLSPQQKRLWLMQRESSAYRAQCAILIEGHLDVTALKEAAQRVVARHDILRTTFVQPAGIRIPMQVIADDSTIYWSDICLSSLAERQQQSRIDELFQSEGLLLFDLEKGPVLRFSLLSLSPSRNVLLSTLPALCADSATLRNLYRELARAYRACLEGKAAESAEDPVRYVQFSEWQRQLLESDEEGRDYWRKLDYSSYTPLTLPLENSSSNLTTFVPAALVVSLNHELTAQVESLVASRNASLAVFLQTCWQILLGQLTRRSEVFINVLCEGRIYEEMEPALGLYAKWLPVPARFGEDVNFAELWQQVDESLAAAREWQEYFSWDHVASGDVAEAFSIGFDFEQWPADIESRGVRFSLLKLQNCIERFKLKLSCIQKSDALLLEFHYDQAFYSAETMKLIAGRLATLIRSVTANPETIIGKLDILDENERRQQLSDWNDTKADFPDGGLLHQLFEVQAERTPDRLAVVCGEVELSYGELNHRANQLAHCLRRFGVGPELRVALCMERSAEMLVGLLGTLKAGAAYVPLDPTQPKSRLAFMLQDAEVSVLLTQQRLLSTLPKHPVRTICMDTDWEINMAPEPTTNPDVMVSLRNLAYVIYTSGSFGNPKGVMVEQASVLNLSYALKQSIFAGHTPEPLRVSLNAPLSFDSSVKQWLQLLQGHTLCVLPEEVRRDGRELLSYLSRQQIDILDCTPSQLWLLLDAGLVDSEEATVALVLLGGEAVEPSTWELLANSSGRTFYNVYGPTECTVDATACCIGAETAAPTIGRPLANMQVYLLDENLEPAPIGVSAEMYIGGVGLARGYLARPDLTAEKFIPHPFSTEAGARLYRTGDFARYRPNGQIEFLGRCDLQVKIRGSRIELGEIEATLEQHTAVRRAAVIVCDDSQDDKRLVAYVVATQEHKLSVGELRSFLQERLPVYMMPATFMMLESLPLTRNGKVDRKALPAPEHARPELERAFVAPRTPVEEMLAGIWSVVLATDQVGRHDNFFELGGHSLLATQAVSRLRKAFQVELPLRALFEAPTIAALAPAVEAARRGQVGLALNSIEPVRRDGRLPLSFAQQRLWFLDQLEPANTAYLIPAAVRLKGTLDVTALERTLNEIARRHETLRTSFAMVDNQPAQIIAPAAEVPLPLIDLQEFSEAERESRLWRAIEEETRRPFNLGRGPQMRANLLRLGREDHVLLLTLHHIIFDAWSIEVLLREVARHYEAFAAGETPKFVELPVQYADYAHWQREWLQGEVLAQQVAYWRRQLDGISMLGLTTDRQRPPFQTFNGKHQSFMLPEALRGSLSELSRREGATMFMTLLAAFQTLLYRYTSQEDISVGTPIANRTRSEIEDLIGFFLNTLVLRTDFSGDPPFTELLQRVRETALAAYTHQDVPFEKLVEELQPERNTSRTPFFQVMFALRSVSQKDMQLSGLTMSLLEIERGTAKFDLLLMIDETDQGLRAEFEYNTDLFDDTTISSMGAHFLKLLESIAADPQQQVSCLPMLTTAERGQLISEWNATQRPTSHARCIHQLFEEQKERTPERVALVYEDEELTYRQLNAQANQLAHYLRGLGVEPDTFVGILMNRSVEMMVSVLGVLKAGGAYLALDPTYPKERLAFMLEDTRASVILTQEHLAATLPASAARVIFFDAERKVIYAEHRQNPPRRVRPENLAYVTYTSGSTGKPKGIAMPQSALLNLLNWQLHETRLPDGARTLQFASLSFDVSFQDMFSTWGMGGTLVMISDEARRDIAGLARVVAEKDVHRLFIPAVALQQLAEGFCAKPRISAALRKVIAGSEQLQITRSIARMFRELANCALHNEYGPSEAHVVTELALRDEVDAWPERPSVGRPIYNTQIYILDGQMQPVPIGVPGELFIGGAGLARCYLNRPDLTAERFIPNAFSDKPDARLYRTGDLARWLAGGDIEFLGRMDFQVKIRGFRVEPGEVEVVLGSHPAVRETIVLAREDTPGNKRLVAYIVPAQDVSTPTVSELRYFLQEKLPDYMTPSAFVWLDALPLTQNGKVNRRALPAPDQARPELEKEYVCPRTALERVIVAQWAETLGIQKVGVEDNFFALGGHSLLATQVVARLREIFQIELPLRNLFESPTVAGIAERIRREAAQPDELEELALVWEELQVLSEAEAQAMLSQERSTAAMFPKGSSAAGSGRN